MRGTHIRVFFFYFEIAQKNISDLSKIFSLGLISGFQVDVFGFLRPIMSLSSCLDVLGINGFKIKFFDRKNYQLCFFSPHSSQKLGNIDDMSSLNLFFFKKTMKKNLVTRALMKWVKRAGVACQAQQCLAFSLKKNHCFLFF